MLTLIRICDHVIIKKPFTASSNFFKSFMLLPVIDKLFSSKAYIG